MAKIVIPAVSGTYQARVLGRAIELLGHADIRAEGRILLVYPVLRVAEQDAAVALNTLRDVGIEARLG